MMGTSEDMDSFFERKRRVITVCVGGDGAAGLSRIGSICSVVNFSFRRLHDQHDAWEERAFLPGETGRRKKLLIDPCDAVLNPLLHPSDAVLMIVAGRPPLRVPILCLTG